MAASKTITVATARGITSQVRVYDTGNASGTAPIVYFHGATGLLAAEPMLDALAAAGRTVYAPVWPGYGDNLRVLEWMLKRCAGRVGAVEAPIGHLPDPRDLNLNGLALDPAVLRELTSIDNAAWRQEIGDLKSYLSEFGTRMPTELLGELADVEQRINS